jgi:hypothetical protein
MAEKKAPEIAPPTVITLTLPAETTEPATLLIQRGDLAHMRLFPLCNEEGEQVDIHTLIDQAYLSLSAVEAAPPVIPAPPDPPKPAPRPVSNTVPPKPKFEEPMLKVEIGKTTRGHQTTMQIPARFVQMDQTEQQPQALLLIGKLIEGKLWDGKSPIRIEDVPALEKKLKYLTVKDLALYSLTELVQPGEDIPWQPPAEPEPVIDEADAPEEEGDPEEEDDAAND